MLINVLVTNFVLKHWHLIVLFTLTAERYEQSGQKIKTR